MTAEPTVWFQLGISDERYNVISKEISSIIKTGEKPGVQMEMIKNVQWMSHDEQLYAAFMIAKADIGNKLLNKLPEPFKGTMRKILEE